MGRNPRFIASAQAAAGGAKRKRNSADLAAGSESVVRELLKSGAIVAPVVRPAARIHSASNPEIGKTNPRPQPSHHKIGKTNPSRPLATFSAVAAAWALLIFTAPLRSEIVDRIAATVGLEVITESQVSSEIRVTAFIEGSTLDFSPENKRKALERLIDQTFIRREVEITRFQQPAPKDVEPLLKQVTGRFPDQPAYDEALDKYGVTQAEVLAHLTWQLTTLRFIEYRFQPSVQVTNSEVRQEYRRQAAAWREKNGTDPPPMDQIRPELEKIVLQKLTDSALDNWLGEVRTQNTILYRGGYK